MVSGVDQEHAPGGHTTADGEAIPGTVGPGFGAVPALPNAIPHYGYHPVCNSFSPRIKCILVLNKRLALQGMFTSIGAVGAQGVPFGLGLGVQVRLPRVPLLR